MKNIKNIVIGTVATAATAGVAFLISKMIKAKHAAEIEANLTEIKDAANDLVIGSGAIEELNNLFDRLVSIIGDINADEFPERVNDAIEVICKLEQKYKHVTWSIVSVPDEVANRIEFLEALEKFYWIHGMDEALGAEHRR